MADFIMNQKKTANFGRSKPAWRSWRTVLFKRKQEELPSLCLLWFSLAYFSPKNLFLHFVQDVRHTKWPCAVWCRAFLLCIRVNDLYCWENKPRLFSWVFNCCLGCGQTCNWHTVWGAGNIAEPNVVEEFHRSRVAAMFAANAYF